MVIRRSTFSRQSSAELLVDNVRDGSQWKGLNISRMLKIDALVKFTQISKKMLLIFIRDEKSRSQMCKMYLLLFVYDRAIITRIIFISTERTIFIDWKLYVVDCRKFFLFV